MVGIHKCMLLHCIYTFYVHIKYNFQCKFLFYSVLMTRHLIGIMQFRINLNYELQ